VRARGRVASIPLSVTPSACHSVITLTLCLSVIVGCALSHATRYALPEGLAVEGFEGLPEQAKAEVAGALGSLPPEHLATVALLRFDPSQYQSGRALRKERVVSLGYRLWTEQLGQPHRMEGVTALEETLVHEIGHQVAFADEGRLEHRFNQRFWRMGKQLYGRPVDDAGLDQVEDFAITYSQYRYNADYLWSCCPERARFMRDEVFGGRAWPSAAPSASFSPR
jgi:hypothetical protein